MSSSTKDNVSNFNMQKICSKLSLVALIILILTIILGFSFSMSFLNSFSSVLDEWDSLSSKVEEISEGGGAIIAIVAPFAGIAGIASLGLFAFTFVVCFCLPVFINLISLILNILARLFQIGIEKKWKTVTSRILLRISTIFQGILCFILLILFILSIIMIHYAGFSLTYLLMYLMIFGNFYVFVKYIVGIKESKN